jgi:hypothetical protein
VLALIQGHTVGERLSGDMSPGLLVFRALLLSRLAHSLRQTKSEHT